MKKDEERENSDSHRLFCEGVRQKEGRLALNLFCRLLTGGKRPESRKRQKWENISEIGYIEKIAVIFLESVCFSV